MFQLQIAIADARNLLLSAKRHVDAHPDDSWLNELETGLTDLVDRLYYSAEQFELFTSQPALGGNHNV